MVDYQVFINVTGAVKKTCFSLIFCVLSGLKATSVEVPGKPTIPATTQKKQCVIVFFPQDSNLQPLDDRSTELEKTFHRMLNFDYLNPTTCLHYDVNNNLIVMFLGLRARVLLCNR